MKSLRTIFFCALFILGFSQAKAQSYFSNIDKAAEAVKTAIAAGNAAVVKSKGMALTLALSGRQNISSPQRYVLGSYMVRLMEEARHISDGANIAYQQEHYNLFMKYWSAAEAKLKIK
jgi:hypothetical protein